MKYYCLIFVNEEQSVEDSDMQIGPLHLLLGSGFVRIGPLHFLAEVVKGK